MEKEIVAIGYDNGSISVFKNTTQRKIVSFTEIHKKEVFFDFSPINNKLFVSVGSEGFMRFFDLEAKKMVQSTQTEFCYSAINFLENGKNVLCGLKTGEVLLYSLEKSFNKPEIVFIGSKESISFVSRVEGWNQEEKLNLEDLQKSTRSERKRLEYSTATVKEKLNSSTTLTKQPQFERIVPKREKPAEKAKQPTEEPKKPIETKREDKITKKEEVFVGEERKYKRFGKERDFSSLSEKTDEYVQTLFSKEILGLKQFVHQEVSNLQFELMKQLELTKWETVEEVKRVIGVNKQILQEMKALKEENARLKGHIE